MRIPLIKPDLPDFDLVAGPFREVLESGRITNFARYVQELEAEAGDYLGSQVATASSGTAGLLLALQALGLQPGGKVILPSFTFMATAQAVLYAGGVPLFAEIEDDLTLSPSDLESILASHEDIGAVIPVHMYGLPCRVDEIQQVIDAACAARSRRIPVLYDAAHAFGSSLEGERVGGFGDAEVFSLSVTKVLVGVEGGMVSSRNPYLIERVRKMRNYGIETGYDAHLPGLNGKMSELHAIVGLHNLRRLDALLVERQWKARRYLDLIHAHTNLATPRWPEGVVHTFKDLTVLLPPGMAHRRAEIMASLRARGIETRAYFSPPVHQQRFFARFADRPLPRTEALARSVITLPFYTSMSEEEMEYVVDGLRRATRMAA